MKKGCIYTAIFFACLLITACNNTAKNKALAEQAAKDTANFTTIQWLDSIVNFGSIQMGETITVRFKCLNTGKKPLLITNAKPGCGCTIADFTKEPIMPGTTGVVTAAFDSKKVHAPEVRKTIIVTTNTINNTEHYLIFTGEVKGVESNDKVAIPHPKK